MASVAFVGLGVMGHPMAGHLRAKGHEVAVWNRTEAKARAWRDEHGGRIASSPRDAAEGAEVVLACVGNDDDLRAVAYGDDGILAGLGAGRVFADHTTASADVARELDAAARDRGARFVDAPVSGGQAGAQVGTLAVMCGGEEAAFAAAEPVMRAYSQAVTLMGPAGAGQLTKMVNQICIAGLLQGLAEGLNFAQAAGLDPDRVLGVVSKGAARSWQMENRWKTMVEGKFDFGFAVDWMRKDLAICLDEARRNGAPLPAAALVDQLYRLVQAAGGGRWDTSSLVHNLRERAGSGTGP